MVKTAREQGYGAMKTGCAKEVTVKEKNALSYGFVVKCCNCGKVKCGEEWLGLDQVCSRAGRNSEAGY